MRISIFRNVADYGQSQNRRVSALWMEGNTTFAQCRKFIVYCALTPPTFEISVYESTEIRSTDHWRSTHDP